jgi:hypothetical protein
MIITNFNKTTSQEATVNELQEMLQKGIEELQSLPSSENGTPLDNFLFVADIITYSEIIFITKSNEGFGILYITKTAISEPDVSFRVLSSSDIRNYHDLKERIKNGDDASVYFKVLGAGLNDEDNQMRLKSILTVFSNREALSRISAFCERKDISILSLWKIVQILAAE